MKHEPQPAASPWWNWVSHNASLLVLLAVLAGGMTVGWALFGGRMLARTDSATQDTQTVSRIWGGPLQQPQPSVVWRRADAATVVVTPGELSRTDVSVALSVQYRRRGVTEYPCYDATVVGSWDFQNPSPAATAVAFSIPLPVERSALMLKDVQLLVDGKEDVAGTVYTADRIEWTGPVRGGATVRFRLTYSARGMERFGYALSREDGKPVTAFHLVISVTGARGALDFPVGSMSPTVQDVNKGTRILEWQVDRLLSSFDIGVVLPDDRGTTRALGRLMNNAPFFFLMFGCAVLFALRALSRRARGLHVVALAAAFFMYFPLASYLTAYLPWPAAAAGALATIWGLSAVYALRFLQRREGTLVLLSLLFFLGCPAAAYLVPTHTGLILVIAGVLALGVGMQLVGELTRNLPSDDVTPHTTATGPSLARVES